MAPNRVLATGGRGHNEYQAVVPDLQATGLAAHEVRSTLKDMGYATARRSQLMKFY